MDHGRPCRRAAGPTRFAITLLDVEWEIEVFEDDDGHQPFRKFLLGLDPAKRAALIAALELVLGPMGPDVCKTEYGKALGQGLFEFRIRHDEPTIRNKAAPAAGPGRSGPRSEVLLRVFFAAYGERIVLLLGGYDKGDDPSTRRQSREIENARKRLRSLKLRRQRKAKGERRRRP